MCCSRYIRTIVLALSVFIVSLTCAFTQVIAQEESEDAAETEVANGTEVSEETSEVDAFVILDDFVVVGSRA